MTICMLFKINKLLYILYDFGFCIHLSYFLHTYNYHVLSFGSLIKQGRSHYIRGIHIRRLKQRGTIWLSHWSNEDKIKLHWSVGSSGFGPSIGPSPSTRPGPNTTKSPGTSPDPSTSSCVPLLLQHPPPPPPPDSIQQGSFHMARGPNEWGHFSYKPPPPPSSEYLPHCNIYLELTQQSQMPVRLLNTHSSGSLSMPSHSCIYARVLDLVLEEGNWERDKKKCGGCPYLFDPSRTPGGGVTAFV